MGWKRGVQLQQIYIASYYRNGYSRFMKLITDILNHPKKKDIEQRLEIIKFFDEFGALATERAFGKSRSTIYLWKQKIANNGGRLSALSPGNKTPLHKRKRLIHPFIQDFILSYRLAHPGVDKTTITPVLAIACQKVGIKSIFESTVGRIIGDLKKQGKLARSVKVFLNGATGKLRFVERTLAKNKLRRKGFLPHQPGDLVQMDTVSIFANGLKRYLFTAIDVKTRLAFAYAYKNDTAFNGRDFLHKFVKVTPFVTSRIQTDNGGEFAGYFDNCCKENDLVHFFNYPRHPQSNAHLERFNGTIQDQFVYWHIDELDELDTFNRNLMEYLIWYNTEKPHRGIENLSPLKYYLNNFFTSSHNSNMLWTLTLSCRSLCFRVKIVS
jgi:putative transposase